MELLCTVRGAIVEHIEAVLTAFRRRVVAVAAELLDTRLQNPVVRQPDAVMHERDSTPRLSRVVFCLTMGC